MPEPTDVHAEAADEAPVEEEVLVEEISIDGMCGVY
jgi:mycofactocin precursor